MKTNRLSRRTFLQAASLGAAAACARPARADAPTASARPPFVLSAEQKARLARALEPLHASYDPAARMLREPFHSPGYHTTLKAGTVHSTRQALGYAVALLDTGEEPLRQRACDVLAAVIALQDPDPASKTYGIWPWFLEEPLAQMSPPDWNWADFCGVQLLQVALDHRGRLPAELASRLDDAIRHAARSIERRNVTPSYTNIAIMGTYVTAVAAELYGWADLKAYATQRLRRFYDYTRQQGAFSEYNSPTYSLVALAELGRMRLHVQDPAARPLIEELYRLVWEEIASHFHAPSRQWAGPHSRCYSTLLKPSALYTIQRACGGALDWGVDAPDISEQRLPLPCPPDLAPRFQSLPAPREVVKTVLKAEPPIVATTWLEPLFALGSASRSEFWNQRRGAVAYWGKPERPAALHVRFLRDSYDFADAQLFTAQRRGDLLAAVNFGLDGGNTHIGLDRIKGGRFTAGDLRLRFEFSGSAAAQTPDAPRAPDQPCRLRFGDLHLHIAVPFAAFGELRKGGAARAPGAEPSARTSSPLAPLPRNRPPQTPSQPLTEEERRDQHDEGQRMPAEPEGEAQRHDQRYRQVHREKPRPRKRLHAGAPVAKGQVDRQHRRGHGPQDGVVQRCHQAGPPSSARKSRHTGSRRGPRSRRQSAEIFPLGSPSDSANGFSESNTSANCSSTFSGSSPASIRAMASRTSARKCSPPASAISRIILTASRGSASSSSSERIRSPISAITCSMRPAAPSSAPASAPGALAPLTM
jgi:hypothetical protein